LDSGSPWYAFHTQARRSSTSTHGIRRSAFAGASSTCLSDTRDFASAGLHRIILLHFESILRPCAAVAHARSSDLGVSGQRGQTPPTRQCPSGLPSLASRCRPTSQWASERDGSSQSARCQATACSPRAGSSLSPGCMTARQRNRGRTTRTSVDAPGSPGLGRLGQLLPLSLCAPMGHLHAGRPH